MAKKKPPGSKRLYQEGNPPMFCCFLLMVLLLSLTAGAAVPAPDPMVRKQLADHKLNFNVSPANHFEIIIKTHTGPEVMVTVESSRLTVIKSAWRHIYASLPLRPPIELALRKKMMNSSLQSRIGAWEISPDERSASFVCKVPVNLSDAHFYAVLIEVSETVARMSLDITKKVPPPQKKSTGKREKKP